MNSHGDKQPWKLLFALLIATVLAFGSAAEAQGHFGVLAGAYLPEDQDDLNPDPTLLYGLEGGYRFNSRFGVSASLSRVDLADAFGFDRLDFPPFNPRIDLELTALDFSFEWYPGGGNFVVLGGPGVARLDFDIDTFGPADEPVSFSDSDNLLSAHVGLGYQWNLTDRLTLRPEARVRRTFDSESNNNDGGEIFYEATDVEARFTLAYKLGG